MTIIRRTSVFVSMLLLIVGIWGLGRLAVNFTERLRFYQGLDGPNALAVAAAETNCFQQQRVVCDDAQARRMLINRAWGEAVLIGLASLAAMGACAGFLALSVRSLLNASGTRGNSSLPT